MVAQAQASLLLAKHLLSSHLQTECLSTCIAPGLEDMQLLERTFPVLKIHPSLVPAQADQKAAQGK